MEIITLLKANENLNKYIGHELSKYAEDFGITIKSFSGGYNKGWKGQVLERLAGHSNNNLKAPNGLGYEIKSTAFQSKGGVLYPRETMAVSMINPKEIITEAFLESHFWDKLKTILFCAVSWDGSYAETGKLLEVRTFQSLEDNEIIKQLEKDYNLIQKSYIGYDKSIHNRHTINGELVQQRTKGSKNSHSMAFYAKKEFVRKIFGI
jgi:DNA mismatch repair protein MutH